MEIWTDSDICFEAFNRKRDILHLLDQSLSTEGVQIFIGEESGYDIFDDLSVVTSTYETDGEVLGVLGVIGPTRMALRTGDPHRRFDRAFARCCLEPQELVPIFSKTTSVPRR